MAKSPTTFPVLPQGRINPAWWVPIALALAGADYLTGHVAVPPVFAVPVTVAAWYSGAKVAIPLAVFLPMMRLLSVQQVGNEVTAARFILGVLTLFLLAVVVSRLERHERDLQERIAALESLLPVCGWCKSIRRADGGWESLEHYMESSGTQVTHGICPDCAQNHWSD
jgi:hypothetical protein